MQLSRRAGAFFFAKFITQLIRSPTPKNSTFAWTSKAYYIINSIISIPHPSSLIIIISPQLFAIHFLFLSLHIPGYHQPHRFLHCHHFIMYCDTSEHPPYHWTDTHPHHTNRPLSVDVDFSLEIRDRDDTFSFLFFFMITDCYLTYRFLHVEHSHRIARTHASIPLSQLYDLGQFPTSRTLFFASFVRPVFGFQLIRIDRKSVV